MEKTFIEDKTFEKIDFADKALPLADYENCVFINCNFGAADLSHIHFIDCEFKHCNLSSAKLARTALKDIRFVDCKMLGLHFDNCNNFLFAISLENCSLNLSSFYQLKLKNTRFNRCSLQEVDFTEADLSNAVFQECDLAGAIFDNTVLERADFRSAFNYAIDPQQNRIKKAKFSVAGITGLLYKYDIQIEQ